MQGLRGRLPESQSPQDGDAVRLFRTSGAASIAARLSGVSKLIRPNLPSR